MKKGTGFIEREDGYWQWDTAALTFLIGNTNELEPHVALWVTSVSTLSYRMIERVKADGVAPAAILDNLKKEAKILVVRSRVIGGAAFFEYTKKRQEKMDEMMFWTSRRLVPPCFILDMATYH
jgi:hypothetical protein